MSRPSQTGAKGVPAGDGWVPSPLQAERDAFRRARARRSGWIAGLSTAVVVAVLVAILVNTKGWAQFRDNFFKLDYGWQVLPDILKGFWLNVRIMVICEVIILVLALTLALCRSLRGPAFFPIRALATIYVDVFRGLPQILVIYLLGLGVPALRIGWLPSSALFWGAVALIVTYAAYVAEVFRAGIESVHPSQRAASRSLGLSHAKTMRYVVMPQAFRRVLPPLLNDLVSLQKDTALIVVLGTAIPDAVLQAQIDIADTFNYTPYVVAGLLFLILTIPMTRLTDWIARRQGWTGAGGTATV